VWGLKGSASVCAGCASGCSVWIDHADDRIYRLRPRFNPKVNAWWICDEGRFGFMYVHDKERLAVPVLRRGSAPETPEWDDVPEIVRFRLEERAREDGADKVAVVLSPFMANEEAWLLAGFVREVAPEAALVAGPVAVEGEDQSFPAGASGDAVKFTILKEKCPNRRGIEMLLESLAGTTLTFEQFVERAGKGDFTAAWIVGGYPKPWVSKELAGLADKFKLLIVQDLFTNALARAATLLLPSCAWPERDGSFVNAAGVVQPFERSIEPPDGARRDGQYLYDIAGYAGLYTAERVRELMAKEVPALADVYEPPGKPVHAH